MHIKRVQIEEGFLDGLDISFSKGLNVLIGERGTGKSSLIELIRFCLGVEGYTQDSSKRSKEHALSILGSGQVCVTLTDSEGDILVSRTRNDIAPRASQAFARPIIFSQTEIENVGLQAHGRLRLLDSFIRDRKGDDVKEARATSEVRSLSAEAETMRREIDELCHQIEEIPAIEKQIQELMPKEQELSNVSLAAKEKKNKLDEISKKIAISAVSVSAIERFNNALSKSLQSVSALQSTTPPNEHWPNNAGFDPLVESRAGVKRAFDLISKAAQELNEAHDLSASRLKVANEAKLNLESDARQLRKEIETLQEGAGSIVREGQQLRERKARLDSLKTLLAERKSILAKIISKRDGALETLEMLREQRFNSRNEVAKKVNETLGPRIRVTITRSGQFEGFAAAIAEVLKGSGLRYNELSSILAESISPRELVEATEANDMDLISDTTGVTKDRAARLLAQLRASDLGTLATVAVEDKASFQLLDGTVYKDINELSTGQRCTVILPLVLRHTNRILIVDQPEDHIDNAFIADTLIRSLLARDSESQTIFTTHNANIPVLGEAERVIQMGSDGRRGFPLLASNLHDSVVVKAITTVMEGGEDAFNHRASFYGETNLHESK